MKQRANTQTEFLMQQFQDYMSVLVLLRCILVGVKIWLYFVPTRVTRPAQFSISAERAFHYILGVILSAGLAAISLPSHSAEHELLYLLLFLSHKIDIDYYRGQGRLGRMG